MNIVRKIIKVLILVAVFAVAFNLSVTIHQGVQASKAPNVQQTTPHISLKMTSVSAYEYGDNTSVTNVLTSKDQRGNWMFRLFEIFKGFANILLFTGLLAFAFANILHINIDTYAIKKLLPKLIVVVLMINLILPIITIFSTLVDRVQTISIFNSYKGLIGHSLPFYSQIESVWDYFSWWDGIKLTLSSLLAIPAMIVVLLISVFVQAGVTLMLALRPTIIYLATAVAPLAIACALLPQTETFFKRWLKVIVFWMVYPLIVSVFAYVISLLPSLTYSQGFIGATLTVSIPLIIKIGFLWFLLRMPFTWEKDVGGLIATIPGAATKGWSQAVSKVTTVAGGIYSIHEMAGKANSGERDIQKGLLGAFINAGGAMTAEERAAKNRADNDFVEERMEKLREENPNMSEPELTTLALADLQEKEEAEKKLGRERLINRRASNLLDKNKAARERDSSVPELTEEAAKEKATRSIDRALATASLADRKKLMQTISPLTAALSVPEQIRKKGMVYALGQFLTQDETGSIRPGGRRLIRGLGTAVALANWRANTGEVVASSARKVSLKESYPWSVNPITQAAYGTDRAKGDLANADTPDAIRAANDRIFDAAWTHFCKLHGYDPESAAAAVAYRKFIVDVNTANSTPGTLGRPEYDEVRRIAREEQFTSPESQLYYVFNQQGKMVRISGRRMTRDPDEANMAFANAMLPLEGAKAPFLSADGGPARSARDYENILNSGGYQRILREGAPSGSPSKLVVDASGVEDAMRDMTSTFKGYADTSSKSIAESVESFRMWAHANNNANLIPQIKEGDRRIVNQLKNLGSEDFARRSATASPLEIENLLKAIKDLKDDNE